MNFRNCFSAVLAATATAAVALLSSGTAAAQTPRYHVTELPLITNAKAAKANAINNAGQVVGATPEGKSYHGWLWTPATATATAKIQALAPLKNFPRSAANDINNTGQVVGKSYGNGQSPTLWQTSAPLSPVNFNDPAVKGTVLPNCVLTEAFAVSDADVTTGTYYVTGYCDYTDPVTKVVSSWQGVVWKMQGAKMVSGTRLQYPDAPPADLEDLVTDPWDVNNLGQVAGDYSPNWQTSPSSPCIWNAEDGTMVQRVSTPGHANAYAINDAGTIAGYDGVSIHAFISAAPYTALIELTTQLSGQDGGSQTFAYGLNNQNQVIGQAVYASTWVRAACLWQPQLDGTFRFYDLNKCKSTGATGIALLEAKAVNNSGWIIGRYSSRSVGRAFLLTPIQ